MTPDNENEPSRWTDLRWQTLLILSKLRSKQQIDAAQREDDQAKEAADKCSNSEFHVR